MRLIHGSDIKRALREIAPTRIAVAYVGIDWSSYVDISPKLEIVLSPTIGSNPSAIMELVSHVGWDRVHFLDHLHSKIYLGDERAAVGSFNLTANGLSAEGLEEAGFLVDDSETIRNLGKLIDAYKSQAMKAYPTVADKVAKVAELREKWDRAIKTGAIRNDSKANSLPRFQPTAADEIYVCWEWGEMEYSDEVLTPTKINNSLAFLESDHLLPDRWLLVWHPSANRLPKDGSQPYWLHIDEVLPNGAVHPQYTKLAIERNDRFPLEPPFALTPPVFKALHAVLRSGKFPEFLDNADPWSINPTLPKLPAFFAALRNELEVTSRQPEPITRPNLEVLRKAFAQRIRAAMDIAVGKKYVTSKIETMLAQKHAVEVAKYLVKPSNYDKPGLMKLAKAKALHLSFESHMLESQFKPLFSAGELEVARWNLQQVDPSYIPPP